MLPHLDGAVGLTVEPVPGWQRTYLCLDPLQVEAGSERQDAPIDLAAPSELIGLPQSEDVLGAMKVVDPEVEQGSGQALVFELVCSGESDGRRDADNQWSAPLRSC